MNPWGKDHQLLQVGRAHVLNLRTKLDDGRERYDIACFRTISCAGIENEVTEPGQFHLFWVLCMEFANETTHTCDIR